MPNRQFGLVEPFPPIDFVALQISTLNQQRVGVGAEFTRGRRTYRTLMLLNGAAIDTPRALAAAASKNRVDAGIES